MTNYNLTNFTDANNVLEYAVAVNDLSSGIFFVLVVCLVMVISFVGLKNYPARDAFVASGFVSLLLTTVLFVVGLVTSKLLLVVFVIFLLSVALAFFSD